MAGGKKQDDNDAQDGSPLILSRGKYVKYHFSQFYNFKPLRFDSNLDLLRPSHSTFLPDIKSQEISARKSIFTHVDSF